MEQQVQVLILDNSPSIDIDPFRQRWADKYEFTTPKALKKQLEKDARLFAVFVIRHLNKIHLSKNENDTNKNTLFDIQDIEEKDYSSTQLLKSLGSAISNQMATIPERICIAADNGYIYTRNKTYCSLSNNNTSTKMNFVKPCNPLHKIKLEDLLTYYWAKDGFEIKNLSLKEQINALTTASNNKTQELKDWQKCLHQLLKDAGNNEKKRNDVRRYIKATQDMLRPSESLNIDAFKGILNELSIKVNRGEMAKDVSLIAAKFLLAGIFGILLAAATANPVTLGIVLVGGIALLGIDHLLMDKNGVTPLSKRLSEGTSMVLNKLGFFQYNEPKEKADTLLKVIQQPSAAK